MTLAQMVERELVMPPADEAEIVVRKHIGAESRAWRGEVKGASGWWWVLVRPDGEVATLGFSVDDRLDSTLRLACRIAGVKYGIATA